MIRYEDLRALSVEEAGERLRELGSPREDTKAGAYLTAWQAAGLRVSGSTAGGVTLAVTAPDFLNYARLLNTGQAAAMLRLSGSSGRGLKAGVGATPVLLRRFAGAAKTDFWVVAEVLLRYDLSLLPASYSGPVLLHGYLADFAFLFEQRDLVTRFFQSGGNRATGIHTQQLPLALSCLARWGLNASWCSFLFSPGDRDAREALGAARRSRLLESCRFCAEVESLPADLQSSEHLSDLPDGLGALLVRAELKGRKAASS